MQADGQISYGFNFFFFFFYTHKKNEKEEGISYVLRKFRFKLLFFNVYVVLCLDEMFSRQMARKERIIQGFLDD